MDNTMARTLAQTDLVLFFQTYKPPIIIDEIQKAPELFEQIKIMCDETEERGLFWLTGSRQYKMMKNIRDTLAGRIGILELYSLSQNEVDGEVFANKLYFCNTGLCVYLSMWLTRDTLMYGAASGHYFENHVVIELLKNFSYILSDRVVFQMCWDAIKC